MPPGDRDDDEDTPDADVPDVIVRGAADEAAPYTAAAAAELEAVPECLFGCGADGAVEESEDGACGRKAAKKVEKKGRWEGMATADAAAVLACIGMSVASVS
jgi:hypothetical protein